jgi:hypothetical protein
MADNDTQYQELMAALAEMGVLPQQQGALQQQMKQADALRATPMPGGRSVSNGRVFVASHPLENVTALGQQLMGTIASKRLGEQQQGLVGQEKDARMKVLQGMQRQQGDYQAILERLAEAIRARNQTPPLLARPPEGTDGY